MNIRTDGAAMQRTRTIVFRSVIALGAVICSYVPGFAAQPDSSGYPSNVVQIVVPSTSTGSLDLVARIAARKLGQIWNQSVIVLNKPGANFIVGTDYAAKASPDGYTLLVAHNGAVAMNPALYKSLPYDPMRDLAPIAQLVLLPMVLYVNDRIPAKTTAEFIKVLQQSRGKYNQAYGGTGAFMVSQMFKSEVGVDYVDVGYKGAAPAVMSVIAGETDFTFADVASGMPALKSSRVRALGVASPKRLKLLPSLPTINESVPNYSETNWIGMFAPAGTPPAILAKVSADIAKAFAAPDVNAQLTAIGLVPDITSPSELARQMSAEIDKWKKLVLSRNIQVNR
jgi:tripartite-type tricarboxylate transporter receptor subunit TctC